MKKSVAFIHARGGSKRIPRKNIKSFLGKAAIAYPIEAAIKSDIFDEVIISTDDQEIANIAVKYGAKQYYLRPAELSNDIATTDQVFQYDIQAMLNEGHEFNHACCIYGTSIFLKPEFLEQAYSLLQNNNNAHSVISTTEYDFSIYRALIKGDLGHLSMREPHHRLTRSQDLPEACHDAAQFYFVPVKNYLKEGRVYPANGMMSVQIPFNQVVDIDTPDDWIRAEVLYKILQQEQN